MKGFNAMARMVTLGVLMAITSHVPAQQSYPSKPVRVILPYPTGGSNDVLARLLAPKLGENWGQAVVVENRAGGNSVIGTEAVAKSAPDGYTVLLTSNIHVTAPLLVATPYDPVKDFAPIASIASSEFVLVVHPSLPVKNLQEFIAYAKSKPGQLDYATPGSGSANHLAVELFNMMTGVRCSTFPIKAADRPSSMCSAARHRFI
jgi:tripartite-type tricarboxylate transporter receptor subunit TctC